MIQKARIRTVGNLATVTFNYEHNYPQSFVTTCLGWALRCTELREDVADDRNLFDRQASSLMSYLLATRTEWSELYAPKGTQLAGTELERIAEAIDYYFSKI